MRGAAVCDASGGGATRLGAAPTTCATRPRPALAATATGPRAAVLGRFRARCHLLLHVSDRLRLFHRDFLGRLVLTKSLVRPLTHVAVPSPTGEFDFGHQFRLDPMNVGLTSR